MPSQLLLKSVPAMLTRRQFRLYLSGFLVFGLLASTVFYAKYQPGSLDFTQWRRFVEQHQALRERKLILVWTNYWERPRWLTPVPELQCPIQECDVIYDKSLLSNSSAVLLHLANVDLKQLPDCNSSHCNRSLRWVLFHHEPPTQTNYAGLKGLRGKIHWTVTYRRDSDILAPYGEFLERTDPYEMPTVDANRSLACWLVSHCHTNSRREDYVSALQKHMPVHVYGRCGQPCGEKGRYECYEWLARRCKFFLSFENSICNEYATEKLFIPMMTSHMVPVVFGGADYARILPARSYVDTSDFAGPRELAEFLVKLGSDTEQYRSYLEWKRHFVVRYSVLHWLCDLCSKLHGTDGEVATAHGDLYQWWHGNANCRSWKPG